MLEEPNTDIMGVLSRCTPQHPVSTIAVLYAVSPLASRRSPPCLLGKKPWRVKGPMPRAFADSLSAARSVFEQVTGRRGQTKSMDLHVIAIADTGTYLAADASGTAGLFTVEIGSHIELGDALRCGSQPAHSPVRFAQNLTQGHPVSLRVQHWAASPCAAISFWIESLVPRPSVVFVVGSTRLLADAADTPSRLQDHIPSAHRAPRPHAARFNSGTLAGVTAGTMLNHAPASFGRTSSR